MDALNLSHEENCLTWTLSLRKEFSVKSCYEFLNDEGLRSNFRTSIWKASVPIKVKVLS